MKTEISIAISGMNKVEAMRYLTALLESTQNAIETVYDNISDGPVCYYDVVVINQLKADRNELIEMIEQIRKDEN